MSTPPIRAQLQKRPAAPAKKLTHWDLLFRFVTVLLIAGSIAVAWWVYSQRLVPLQQQSKALSASLGRLSAEVEILERKWPHVEREQIRSDYT